MHTHVWEDDFKLLGNNYQSNIKWKINESSFIRQLKPSLNKQDKSIPLNLYNLFLIAISTYIDKKPLSYKNVDAFLNSIKFYTLFLCCE